MAPAPPAPLAPPSKEAILLALQLYHPLLELLDRPHQNGDERPVVDGEHGSAPGDPRDREDGMGGDLLHLLRDEPEAAPLGEAGGLPVDGLLVEEGDGGEGGD